MWREQCGPPSSLRCESDVSKTRDRFRRPQTVAGDRAGWPSRRTARCSRSTARRWCSRPSCRPTRPAPISTSYRSRSTTRRRPSPPAKSRRLFQARGPSLGKRNSDLAPDRPIDAPAVSQGLRQGNPGRGYGALRRSRQRSRDAVAHRGLGRAGGFRHPGRGAGGGRADGPSRRQTGRQSDRRAARAKRHRDWW